MPNLHLRWLAGDRARWRDMDATVEYVAEDGALISYVREPGGKLRFAIVSLADLDLRWGAS
jgi:hypothetical protein